MVLSRQRARELRRQRLGTLTFRRTFLQTRKRGHSALRAWAYRFGEAGESRFPDKDGAFDVDYTNRHGIGPRGCELPKGADESWGDGRTWAQRIEEKDYRRNSRQFRDDVIAFPRAVVDAGRAKEVVKAYAKRIAKKWGTAVHWVIHDLDGANPHAHVCYAGRRIEGAEFAAKRDREQDAVTRPAKGTHPATQSITDLHSEYWIETLADVGLEASFEQSDDAQAHVGPKAWSVEKRAIRNEIAAELLEIYPEASAEELQAAAHAAMAEITVTQALAMDRDPVTEAMQDCPKPGGPAIAPDEPLLAPAPGIEADEALAPPIPIAAREKPLSPPTPSIAAELDVPAPTVTPDRPIEAPAPIAAREKPLSPPAPSIAVELYAPAPQVTPDRGFDRAPAPDIAAELNAPAPAVTPDRPIEAPAPIVAIALAPPAPQVTPDRSFSRGPAPSIAQDEPLPAPAPIVAAPLPEPAHIREERRLKDAKTFEAEKRKAAEQAARARLAGAVTADTLEAAGEALIRSHAGDASAHAHIAGVPLATSQAAVRELRNHVKPFQVRERDRRLPGRSFTGRDYERHRNAVSRKIEEWGSWWRGGWLSAGTAVRIVPAMIRDLWPTHWQQTQDDDRRVQQEIDEKAARTRRQREQALARPRIVETPAPRKDRGPSGWDRGV